MADEKPQPNVKIPPEPTKVDQIEMQQRHEETATQKAPRSAPPRQPLFGK